jgi:hypothetical protein
VVCSPVNLRAADSGGEFLKTKTLRSMGLQFFDMPQQFFFACQAHEVVTNHFVGGFRRLRPVHKLINRQAMIAQ